MLFPCSVVAYDMQIHDIIDTKSVEFSAAYENEVLHPMEIYQLQLHVQQFDVYNHINKNVLLVRCEKYSDI